MYSLGNAKLKHIMAMRLHNCTDDQRKVLIMLSLLQPDKVAVCFKYGEPIGGMSLIPGSEYTELSAYSITNNVATLYKSAEWCVNNLHTWNELEDVYIRTTTKFGAILLQLIRLSGKYIIKDEGTGVLVTYDRT